MTTSTEAHLKITLNSKPFTDTGLFNSSNQHKWLPYQILGGKSGKNVQIDSKTTEIWPKQLNVTLSVSELICE